MRSRTPEDLSGRCPGCYLPTALCLCAEVPRVETRTDFLVIRHNKETHTSTNTARLAALALPRCRILTYGAPRQPPFDVSVLTAPGTWLLFPDAQPPPAPNTRRLRRSPHPYGMSTVEAIAGALAVLEGEALALPLLELHELMIDRVLAARGRFGDDD